MDRTIGVVSLMLLMWTSVPAAQTLSPRWEELTASDFVKALEASGGTCALPFGILEKHGPAGPLGTDLINVRYTTLLAAREEYTIIFPEYYFGQIFEAKHQPGTIAYSAHLQLELLQETVAEMARNGCRKIVIVNGHGGNNQLLSYFAQTQLESSRDYIVYAVSALGSAQGTTPAAAPSRPGVDGHAGEGEIANVMASRPELAHPERSSSESGADLNRLELPEGVFTGIGWYAKIPQPLRGRFSRRHRGTRPGVDERDGRPHRECATRHQTRRNWSQTSERVLRQDGQAGTTMNDRRRR